MALYAKIKCGNCGHTFELFHSDMDSSRKPTRCPHCLRQMTDKHWETLVDAFMTAYDWNYQNAKASAERGIPNFTVEFRNKFVPTHKVTMN